MRLMMIIAAATLYTLGAAAQDWPTRPVTMVVPFAAGGPTDAVGRVFAQALGETLGKPVVVENLGGAGGMTGANRVAHAAADGYTALFGGASGQVYNQLLYKKPLYNSRTDFAPVALLTDVAAILVARKDLPATTLAEFRRYLAANDGTTFGSAGVGSSTHLACALLNTALNAHPTHVPYRGAAPAVQDLMAGRIDYMCDLVPDAVAHVSAGAVKAIAMLAQSRSAILPDVATADEQGLAGFEASSWYALFLPKGAPASVVSKLNAATVAALELPSLRQRFRDLGVTVVKPERRSPEYLAHFIDEELVKWAGPIRAGSISVE
jgi:tripartite-type tricarboxylate transporter receptor subunit TctC